MATRMSIFAGSVIGLALVVAALWAWGKAPYLVQTAKHPDVAAWAVRSAAIAAAAAGQVLLVTLVVGRIYRRDRFGRLLWRGAGWLGAAATVSAIALGLAGL